MEDSWIVWMSVFIAVFGGCLADFEYAKLIKALTKDYDPRVRPVRHVNQTVDVQLLPRLHQVIDLKEKNQVLSTKVWLSMMWRDELLQWDPAEYAGLRSVSIPASSIWRPDIVLYNSLAQDKPANSLDSNFLAILTYDGIITWIPPGIWLTMCQVDVTHYPFDTQHCEFIIGTWVLDVTEANITVGVTHEANQSYIENNEWSKDNFSCYHKVEYYPCCKNPYPVVHCMLSIRRRPLYYIFNLILPCFLIVLVGAMAFAMPPECGERVSFSITVLLAIMVFQMVLMENIPSTSRVLPFMGMFIDLCMMLLGLSTAVSVLMEHLKSRDSRGYPPPYYIKKVFVDILSPVLFIKEENPCPDSNKWHSIRRKTVKIKRPSLQPNSNNSCKIVTTDGEQNLMLEDQNIRRTSPMSLKNDTLAEMDLQMKSTWWIAMRTIDRCFLIIYIIIVAILVLYVFVKYHHHTSYSS